MLKKQLKRLAYFCSTFSRKKISMLPKDAEKILNDYYPYNTSYTCVGNNSIQKNYELHIIIPAYNAEKYILECLDSILSQKTKHSFFVTVVNDGSTDETENLVKNFISKNKDKINIELINQKNLGPSEARNKALKNIKGEFVTFVDSDDKLSPYAVEVLLECAHKEEIVQAGWKVFKNDKIIEKHVEYAGYPWAKVYDANLFRNFKFPPNIWFEDTVIWLILEQLNIKKQLVNDYIYFYRINNGSITSIFRKYHKAIDTFYVTKLCVEESQFFDVTINAKLYELYLKQFITNWHRTKECPRRIRKAIFVLEGELLEKYFLGIETENKFLKQIATALKNKEFNKFEMLSLSYLGQ